MKIVIKQIIIILVFVLSCSNSKNQELNKLKIFDVLTTELNNKIYNDILNDLIENNLYERYAGKKGQELYKKLVTKKIDSLTYEKNLQKIYNNIKKGNSEKSLIILNSKIGNTFIKNIDDPVKNINLISQYFGKHQYPEIIDSLSKINSKLDAKKFEIDLAKIKNEKDLNNISSNFFIIGKISFSNLFLNKELNQGLLYYSFNCKFNCGKDELLLIEKENDKWIIKDKELLLIY